MCYVFFNEDRSIDTQLCTVYVWVCEANLDEFEHTARKSCLTLCFFFTQRLFLLAGCHY